MMVKVKIKYCGGCNPYIDRPQLVRKVLEKLKTVTNVEIVSSDADVGLIVGGCPVCCVDQSEIEDQASAWIIVGGTLVNHVDVPVTQMPEKICEEILNKTGYVGVK
jgi:hypothetical protein